MDENWPKGAGQTPFLVNTVPRRHAVRIRYHRRPHTHRSGTKWTISELTMKDKSQYQISS
jgi:hypothetical protein